MTWPEGFVYAEKDQSPLAGRLPFLVRADLPTLRVVIDSRCAFDDLTRRYLDLLDRDVTEALGIEVVEVCTELDADIREGVWHLRGDTSSPDRYLGEWREGKATRQVFLPAQFTEFVDLYRRRRSVTSAVAWSAHGVHEVARLAGAHILITTREPLFGFRRDGVMFACRPGDAVAMIGLHQRLRGSTVVGDQLLSRLLSVSWMERLAVQALLPELNRAPGPLSEVAEGNHREVRSLLASMATRFERVLGDRDQLITQTLVAGRSLPSGSPAALTERIALNLSSAFDSLARAINSEFKLGFRPGNQCSFTQQSFRRAIPDVVKGAWDGHGLLWMLKLIRLLRNTIHDETLGEGTLVERQPDQRIPLAVVPAADADDVREACGQLGRSERWLYEGPPGIDLGGLPVKALPVTEDLLRLAVSYCRRIVTAAWPDSGVPAIVGQPHRWDQDPDLLDQVLMLYGLSGCSIGSTAGFHPFQREGAAREGT